MLRVGLAMLTMTISFFLENATFSNVFTKKIPYPRTIMIEKYLAFSHF